MIKPRTPIIFRNLENYKAMHTKTAKSKGLTSQLLEAKTLTRARAILFGERVKSYTCKCGQPLCRRGQESTKKSSHC